MDTLGALRLLRVKGFTGPIEISTSLSDNTVDGEHTQHAFSSVRIYDERICEKGEYLEDVVRKQVLKQTWQEPEEPQGPFAPEMPADLDAIVHREKS